jgi:hypothetical protein
MSREIIQNLDGSFFISNQQLSLPSGPRHAYRDQELGWDVDGTLGILSNSDKGYASIVPIIKPLQAEGAKYDLSVGELEYARGLGSLVNHYAFQAEIVRDETGTPSHLSTRTHITLLSEREGSEGQLVYEPVMTLLDYGHPAHPDYYDGFDSH